MLSCIIIWTLLLTVLVEYLDLKALFTSWDLFLALFLGHMHLSTSKINNSPHKLSFQISMRAGDQKLRFDLVWPKHIVQTYCKQKLNDNYIYIYIYIYICIILMTKQFI